VILDVDTGLDDAIALALAVSSPDLEVIGVTTVRGNQLVHVCTENSLRVLDHLGSRAPVFEGCAQPLLRRFERSVSPTHGEYIDLPPSRTPKQPQHAVDWLISTLLESEGDIVLIPVGPLTNIAMAMRRAPAILPKIRELVIMGGGHAVRNMTPASEFNIWVDPHAARIVMGCGRPIRLVTLDATTKARVGWDDVATLRATGAKAALMAADILASYIEAYDNQPPVACPGTAPVHDALAVLALLEPEVVRTELVHVDVETEGELTSGMTVCDFQHAGTGIPNVRVAVDADRAEFVRRLVAVLGRRD
jgi:inosine-uridine nucleoside N-ribohydrolase